MQFDPWFAPGASESLAGSTPPARASDGEEGRDNTGTHRVASRLMSRLTSSRCQGRAEKPVKKQAPEARRERKQKFTSETWKRQQPKVGGLSHVFLHRIDSLPPAPESFVDSPSDDFRFFETTLNLLRIAYISEDAKVKTR